MNETNIRKYAVLMQELGLTGLEITEADKMVRLERTAPAQAPQTIAIEAVPAAAAAAPPQQVHPDTDCISIKSPIVGVFYSAPAENAEPFVTAGKKVEKGDTLCIVEAMKLMNEITAEESGTIIEVCVENGQIVEYGTELFRIRR